MRQSYFEEEVGRRVVRIISQETFTEDTFEEGSHTVSSELYFRETGYKLPASVQITVIDHKKRCLINQLQSISTNEYSLGKISIAVNSDGRCYLNDEKPSKTWKCTLTCRTFDDKDRQIVTALKMNFVMTLLMMSEIS